MSFRAELKPGVLFGDEVVEPHLRPKKKRDRFLKPVPRCQPCRFVPGKGYFHGLLVFFIQPVVDRAFIGAEKARDFGAGQSLLHVAFDDGLAAGLNDLRIFLFSHDESLLLLIETNSEGLAVHGNLVVARLLNRHRERVA